MRAFVVFSCLIVSLFSFDCRAQNFIKHYDDAGQKYLDVYMSNAGDPYIIQQYMGGKSYIDMELASFGLVKKVHNFSDSTTAEFTEDGLFKPADEYYIAKSDLSATRTMYSQYFNDIELVETKLLNAKTLFEDGKLSTVEKYTLGSKKNSICNRLSYDEAGKVYKVQFFRFDGSMLTEVLFDTEQVIITSYGPLGVFEAERAYGRYKGSK